MPSPRRLASLLSLALLVPASALAADETPAAEALFEVSTEGSSTKLRAGEQGLFVLSVHTKSGAHVSDEAPLKLVLASTQLAPEKTRLGQKDSVAKKEPGKPYTDPRFEVPFTARTAGKATLDAKLTFFLCMEERCERKERAVTLPVEVL